MFEKYNDDEEQEELDRIISDIEIRRIFYINFMHEYNELNKSVILESDVEKLLSKYF